MSDIDPREAAATLSEIDSVARRVRQSRAYHLCSLLMILWGALVLAGDIATFFSPGTGRYVWPAVYVLGIAGSCAISSYGFSRTGTRTFNVRMLVAFLLFFAFGFFCVKLLGHFNGRQQGAFWPVYFMLFYSIAGLWFGYAFLAIGLAISALTLIGYFYIDGSAFLLWMAFVNGGGLILGGLWMRRS
jgi:hypothetical protein